MSDAGEQQSGSVTERGDKDAGAAPVKRDALDSRPLLPDRSVDETDVGWGERPQDNDRDRLLRDRPPHWDDY